MPPHPSIFFRKDLFNVFGNYNIGFRIAADYELLVRFFLVNKISWKYSGITTTSMLVGGLSTSGYHSYKLISSEISTALSINGITFHNWIVKIRFLWKFIGYINLKF
jgi:hypothetical protein